VFEQQPWWCQVALQLVNWIEPVDLEFNSGIKWFIELKDFPVCRKDLISTGEACQMLHYLTLEEQEEDYSRG
jgi:hypothetical protein